MPLRTAMMMLLNCAASASWVLASMARRCCVFCSVPTGVLALADEMAACTSLTPSPRDASASGSSWTRTAYFWLPKICTWATPSIVDRAGANTCWAKASSFDSGVVSLRRAISRMGASAGFTFR